MAITASVYHIKRLRNNYKFSTTTKNLVEEQMVKRILKEIKERIETFCLE